MIVPGRQQFLTVVLGRVVQLLLHSDMLDREISENHEALSSVLVYFIVFFLSLFWVRWKAEHNPFSQRVLGKQKCKNPCKAVWSCCCY